MIEKILTFIVGHPLPTGELAHKRLDKIRALAAFSPDALSSVAYASQEIYLGLVVAGSAGLRFAFPIAASVVLLLVIVAFSYFQTIQGYPSGGGSYKVAYENLGRLPGQVAGAALMIAYLLTAAVSLTAGVEALVSAFPGLWQYRVLLALVLLLLILLINLRGVQESGTIMAVPVYLFIFVFGGLIFLGLGRETLGVVSEPAPIVPAVAPITIFLLLHTFSTGCTALTGVEAISNGVPSFHPPEAKNAGITLVAMALIMGFLFAGSVGLIQSFQVIAGEQETILSALARKLVGNGAIYYLIQISTLLVLAVAANTSFVGFPRLAYILAQDKFLPHQLTILGDRLVYTNGMLLLAGCTAVLIVVFRGETHALIPLFASGALLTYTLSQLGMVIHWTRDGGKGWLLKGAINGLGALVTGAALLVVGASNFLHGAWLVFLLIPGFVIVFRMIHDHYQVVASQLTLRGLPPSLKPYPGLRLVLPISGVHRGVVDAVNLARTMSNRIVALYIEMEPGTAEKVKIKWEEWFPDIPLVIEPSPYRSLVGPLLAFLDRYDEECNDTTLAGVVLPEFVPAQNWQRFLHNQQAELLKQALLYRRRQHGFQRVIIDVPYHLKR